MGRNGPRLLGDETSRGPARAFWEGRPGRPTIKAPAAGDATTPAPPSPRAKREVEAAAQDAATARNLELDALAAQERGRRAAERAEPSHRLSQTNRGLRMILMTGFLTIAVSWAATLGHEYISYLKIQEFTKGDPNAMRVMCAVNPPSERDLGMMHLCETAAKN